jgi:ABC-type dipeptide/oligopeptide/nickel transport system permease subunit
MTTQAQTDLPQGPALAGQAPGETAVPFLKMGERGIYRDAARRFFRNRLSMIGFALVIGLLILAIFADTAIIAVPLGQEPQPLIARTPYDKIFFGPAGAFPSMQYWMGTDLNGRDLFSRIVFGARVSLTIGILAQLVACGIGIPLGALAGWKGGRVDFVIMRVVDVMSALPTLLFAYLIMARLGAGFWNVMLAIAITTWISVCRLTRAQFLTLREKEFVEASRMIGAKSGRIISNHLLPNALAPIIVSLTLGIPLAIFAEASLSFLGVGINPPMPSWGQMIGRDGVTNMTFFWHLAFFPALMIAITMLGFTLMGDGLRDALDPQMIYKKH